MMTDQVEKLIVVLETLEGNYKKLLSVMTFEKQATLNSNADVINSMVTRRQEVMTTLAGLEQQRQGLLQQIAAQLRMPVSKLTLSKLAESTNEIQTLKIDRLGASLAKLLKKVQQANDENRALVQHCLGLVQSTLGFFQQWLAPATVYGNKGQINDGTVSGKLLSGMV